MKNFFDKMKDQVGKFFSGMSKGQRGRLIFLCCAIVVFSVVLAVVLNQTNYGVLYTGLDAEEAGNMLNKLEELGYDAKTQNSDTILVPEDEISEIRVRLAAEGYSGTTGLSLDIFSEGSGMGMTDMEKNTYLQYQYQQDLATIIKRMDKVEECLVFLNMAEDTTFVLSNDTAESSATVMVELASGTTLTSNEARSIAEVVASGVGIDVGNVSVTDTKMNVYSLEGDDTGASGGVAGQLELQQYVRSQLEDQVINLLAPVYGTDNVRASVNVVLNFDQVTTQTITFEPITEEETGAIVSIAEQYRSEGEGDAVGGAVGTDANMGTDTYVYDGLREGETYHEVVREINYELNETQQVIEEAQGSIEELSVAVVLDEGAVAGDYARNVRNLVSQALGIDAEQIAVEQLPFQESDGAMAEAIAQQQALMETAQTNEMIRMIVIGVLVVLAAVAVWMLLRSLFKAIGSRPQLAAAPAEGPAIDYTVEDQTEPAVEQVPQPENEMAAAMDLNMKSSPVTRLERMVEQDPEAVAQLLRNWLWEE